MLQLIGFRSNTPVEIRERISVTNNNVNEFLSKAKDFCDEIAIVSTCNRTEFYLISSINGEELIKKIFNTANWNEEYKKYIFAVDGKRAAEHLFEVACGYHSKILGEDQILAQVKNALDYAKCKKTVSKNLTRLFENAISCGKEFKMKTSLNSIPVSTASITVKEAIKAGCNSYMLVGFGEINKLVYKYLTSHQYEKVYIVVRDTKKVNIKDKRVSIINIKDKNSIISKVDCIITATSSQNPIISKDDFKELREQVIFDLAIPRDVDEDIKEIHSLKVYNVDDISGMDIANKEKRKEVMEENKFIIKKHIEQFISWESLQILVPQIKRLKSQGDIVYKKRYKTFINKVDSNKKDLLEILFKSTSDAFINRAIEVLKEETLKGENKECIRIIEKIFLETN